MKYREMNVRYVITEEEYNRLCAITRRYKRIGLDLPPERMFECMMVTDSKHDVDRRLQLHEEILDAQDQLLMLNKGLRRRKDEYDSGISKGIHTV